MTTLIFICVADYLKIKYQTYNKNNTGKLLFISLNCLALILLVNMADIENITISTPEFSFEDIPCINGVISSFADTDYSIYIYIVIAFVSIVLSFLIYKYYTRGKNVTFNDELDNCYEDSCES